MVAPIRQPQPQQPRRKFELGRVMVTRGAAATLGGPHVAMALLARHQSGDWGDLGADDRRANDEAIAHEGDPDRQSRVVSAYEVDDRGRFYVITEWDRSVTTILRPDEY